jgi:hypothetical protein
LNLLRWHNMKMALPPYIPMLWAHNMGNHTRVDNVFCTEELMDTIIKCKTDDAGDQSKQSTSQSSCNSTYMQPEPHGSLDATTDLQTGQSSPKR